MTDQRIDRFSLDAFPAQDDVVILGDVNGHHPAWDVSCFNPDRVGQLIHDWASQRDWQILNTGASTRSGYGEAAQLSAPNVTLAQRNLARRCTWQTGTDLGSDHLPQVITAAVSGRRPRHIRKERWAFHKADWTGFTAACETAAADRGDTLYSFEVAVAPPM